MKDRNITKRAVLGIDAAWTASQPSGVALAVTALDARPSGRIRAWRHRRPACRNEINDARHGDLVLNSGNNRAGR